MIRSRKLKVFGVVLSAILFVISVSNQTVCAQVTLNRSITKTGPSTATSGVPFDYILRLAVPGLDLSGFVITDTLPGGISFSVCECLTPPCPPNPCQDIPDIVVSPITGTTAIGFPQVLNIFRLTSSFTISAPLTYTIRIITTPIITTTMVITNTVQLPNDINPNDNFASVATLVNPQQAPGRPVSVPTLRDWGMIIMIILLGATALYSVWRRKVATVIKK